MDDGQTIANAERENRHDRPRDSVSLICTVLTAQHRAIQELLDRLDILEAQVRKRREPW